MNNKKYSWVSINLDSWLKAQSNELKKKGLNIPPSDISEILVKDFLEPKGIRITPPRIEKLKFKRIKGGIFL